MIQTPLPLPLNDYLRGNPRVIFLALSGRIKKMINDLTCRINYLGVLCEVLKVSVVQFGDEEIDLQAAKLKTFSCIDKFMLQRIGLSKEGRENLFNHVVKQLNMVMTRNFDFQFLFLNFNF